MKRFLNKLFGGLKMSWLTVIAMAVICAFMTFIFLAVPFFKNTSFNRMGVYLEAWILPAVVIMANCASAKESALKVFVFFLISQPLIYLFQVPFAGWEIFRFYGYWFIWTLATLPAAFIGWYINRRDWWSVLIFAPVLAYLGHTAAECGRTCYWEFPRLLITVLFCIGQILLYVFAFFPKGLQKLVGVAVPTAAAIVFLLTTPPLDMTTNAWLPDGHAYTDDAIVYNEDDEKLNVQLIGHENGKLYIHASQYGTFGFRIEDEGKTYRYEGEVYRLESGYPDIRITYLGEE